MRNLNLRAWLQLFRAQTAPATLLLVLVPYLTNAPFFDVKLLILALYSVLVHYFSFGHNSLLDTAMGYDVKDPSKAHHPLVSGVIKLSTAHNVIHFGLGTLAVIGTLFSLYAANPVLAILCLFNFWTWGHCYNDGTSKTSLLSFLPICLCFTFLGAWGWFLSHGTMNYLGLLLLAYFFMTILFQISWSGHLKELELREHSNILVKMGAKVENGNFEPSYALVYGGVIKFVNVPILGGLLLGFNLDVFRLIWLCLMIALVCRYLFKLIQPREYVRERELFNMSIMEVLTIYTPIPLVLPWLEAIILMAMGIVYFFGMNKALWRVSYPAV